MIEKTVRQYWEDAHFVEQRKTYREYGDLYHFQAGTNTTRYDFDLKISSSVWAQWDNLQDASYFGSWINPFDLTVVDYIEGDIYWCEFESEEKFCDYIINVSILDDYLGIDALSKCKEKLTEMGLGEYLH